MNIKKIRLLAFLTSITCITSLASCGTDVPQAENSGTPGEFSISAGIADENSDADSQETEPNGESTGLELSSAETTSGNGESTESGTETTTIASFSIQTRDPESIKTTTKKVTTAENTTTKAVIIPTVSNNQPNNTTTANQNANTNTDNTGEENSTTTTVAQPSGLSGITLSYYSADVMAGQTIEYPLVSENISEIWTSSDENVATVDQFGNITGVGEGSCIIKVVSATDSSVGAEVVVTVKKQQGIEQIDGITYVNGILIANKTYSLPSDYDPQGLTNETYNAFQELAAGAANDGLNIYLSSGYRSYSYQNEIYNNYVYWYGQETADTFSARPGHSEHQTGLAIDVNTIDDSFAGTPEAIWLEEHCIEYGFIIRYPKGKSSITGYKYEPWHIRYVGKDVAQAVHDAAVACGDPTLTLEEYLGINSSYQ